MNANTQMLRGPRAAAAFQSLTGFTRRATIRDTDSSHVRAVLTIAQHVGWDHPDYPGLIRAAEILRYGEDS